MNSVTQHSADTSISLQFSSLRKALVLSSFNEASCGLYDGKQADSKAQRNAINLTTR
ncbi:hypothetical protein N9B04_01445 [bacterium]|nr:hypothetical protein [bacterium]